MSFSRKICRRVRDGWEGLLLLQDPVGQYSQKSVSLQPETVHHAFDRYAGGRGSICSLCRASFCQVASTLSNKVAPRPCWRRVSDGQETSWMLRKTVAGVHNNNLLL